MLHVQGLTRHFGKHKAVDGLDFSVEKGELFGLLGPNGAGKTTTLRMLATLLKPDAGTIRIGDVSAVDAPLQARKLMAYVPAEAGLPPRMSGVEVVTWFARIQGVKQPAAKAKQLLERVGATPFQDVACQELSTGMKRRIVLARALVHGPQLLLLDEPTDGLDVPGRRDVLNLVRDLAAQGAAIVVSSHIMSEVQQLVQRATVMRQGALVATGNLQSIIDETGAATLDDAFLRLVEQ